jgi:hypothetical protein
MRDLIRHPLIFFVISLVLMFCAAAIGATVLRRIRPLNDETRADFDLVQSATLTLLALIIGFSLSMAVGRYDQRKNYEEEEANAIGTEYLRADLLSAVEAANVRSLLIRYLDQRIQFYQVRDQDELNRINATTAQLQAQLWAAAKSGASASPNPLTALAVAGMNDVINTQGYTQAAWWNHIPISTWTLMIVIGLFCNVMVGYGSRSTRTATVFLLIMPVVVSLSFTLIADIDSPRNGIIRVVPQNLISTAQALPKA